MTRRAATGVAVGLVVVALAVGARAAEQVDETQAERWDAAMADARRQAEVLAFVGTVVVEWRDASGAHREELDVRRRGGVTEIGADRKLVAHDSSRLLADGRAWTMLAQGELAAQPEAAKAKYTIVERNGDEIAGRPTTVYEARRGDTVVTRVYLDVQSRLVLKRETFDDDGEVARAVEFTRLELLPRDLSSSSVPAAAGAPDPLDGLERPLRDPGEVGDQFHLVGRWQYGSVAQLYYSDGVLGVSVFEQRGALDWERLPGGGEEADVAGHDARRYESPVGEALVFERAGVVYTCVGDVPEGELAAIAEDVSSPDDGTADRFARLVIAPLRW